MCESCNSFLKLYNNHTYKVLTFNKNLYRTAKILQMIFYYYIFMLIMILNIMLLIRYFILSKDNIPVRLFTEALKNEKSGYFEEAIINYEIALKKFKKIKSHSTLKNKISEKLRLLHTLIENKENLLSGAPGEAINN